MRKLWAYVLVACIWVVPILLLAQNACGQDLGDMPPAPSLVSVSPNESGLLPHRVNAETVEVETTKDIEDVKVNEDRSRQNNSNHLKIADSLASSFIRGSETSAEYKVVAAPSPQGRTITVTAYAYCLNGRTASGYYTGPGCIAVDPNVIPIGSKIYVPGYGWGEARDTGGGIYGNKIDIWLPNNAQCSQWGVRTVTVTVAE
mgnify:FL=1